MSLTTGTEERVMTNDENDRNKRMLLFLLSSLRERGFSVEEIAEMAHCSRQDVRSTLGI